MILVFWRLNFKPAFPLSSFTFIKRLFNSSLLSAIRVISSAYLWLIFPLAILIPTVSYLYFAYKLNKQGDDIQPWHTAFPILNHSIVPCPILTFVSWPAYRFHRRHVRWYGIPISWKIFIGCCDPHSQMEKEMATHPSTLSWKILWTEEPGRLQSMG